jgi:hypothetical protein
MTPGPSITWTEVIKTGGDDALLRDGDTIMSGVPFGNGYVLAGNASSAARAVIWQSSDGASWQRIDDGPSFTDSLMSALVTIPGGLLAIGEATGGDGLCPGGEGATCNPASPIRMWSSADGRAWRRLPDAATAAFGRAMLGPVAAGRDGLVVFGWRVPVQASKPILPAVWTSTDGRTWQVRKQFATTFPDSVVEGLTASVNGFAAVGRNTGLEAPRGAGAAWWSEDGTAWAAATVPVSTDDQTSVYTAASGLLATGDAGRVFWFSRDGRSWSTAEASAFPFASRAGNPVLLSDGSRMVAVGVDRAGVRGTWVSSDGMEWQSVASTGTDLPIPTAEGGAIGALGSQGAVLITYSSNATRLFTSVWVGSQEIRSQ